MKILVYPKHRLCALLSPLHELDQVYAGHAPVLLITVSWRRVWESLGPSPTPPLAAYWEGKAHNDSRSHGQFAYEIGRFCDPERARSHRLRS